jgi:hypothetical protein
MGFRIEDDCVGCPQGCINCGRKHVHVYYCDRCDAENEPLYEADNGEEVCWDCYKEQYTEKICDDMDEQRCNECGSDAEYLYEVEPNVWLCESCLKEMAERVNEE